MAHSARECAGCTAYQWACAQGAYGADARDAAGTTAPADGAAVAAKATTHTATAARERGVMAPYSHSGVCNGHTH